MSKYEIIARDLKTQGNNCSYSVYNAYTKDLNLSGNYPEPRSIKGKCGALLTGLFILEEIGCNDKKQEFEEEFKKEFGYCKCVELMRHERRCDDYVGWSANRINDIMYGNK